AALRSCFERRQHFVHMAEFNLKYLSDQNHDLASIENFSGTVASSNAITQSDKGNLITPLYPVR
ncbi:MAG: hypothetical protein ACXADH_17265, partial [Candidatus Kariarchaeaceae archaeon]